MLCISLLSSKPTKSDIAQNSKFEKYLDKIEPLATDQEIKDRELVLTEIQKIVNKWVQEVSSSKGFVGDALKVACGKVFTFGSYRLGLITPASDVDTLVVAPKHVDREDFFGTLLPVLEKNPNVTELAGVPDAVVPIIKMKYNSIDVDLSFARLNLSVIDSSLENLESNNLLKHLDEKTVRAMNGTRVADSILKIVPNAKTYRTVLRFVRNWAKARGLYSNAMGYFGGITWAILSARVCQMYPNFTPLQICAKFFLVFSRWTWTNPVTICPIIHSTEVGLMGFKIWNPKLNASDRFHLMPIVTPAFPCMNSTYNVSETTKKVIVNELIRGVELLKSSGVGFDEELFNKLITPLPILSLFSHYLVIQVRGDSEEVFNKFSGFVESRIRMLFRYMQSTSGLEFSRPWPKPLESAPHVTNWVIGLSLANDSVVDFRSAIAQFHEKLADWSETDKFEKDSYSVGLFHVPRSAEFLRKLDGGRNDQVAEWLGRRVNSGDVWTAAAAIPSLADMTDPNPKRVKLDVGDL